MLSALAVAGALLALRDRCTCEPGSNALGHEADCLERDRTYGRIVGGPVLVEGTWASNVGTLLDEVGSEDVFTCAPEHAERVREIRQRAIELSDELEGVMVTQLEAADAR